MQEEIFKDIPGYEGMYQVSNLGNVKSLSRLIKKKGIIKSKEKILKTGLDAHGYKHVVLCKDYKKQIKVHLLVVFVFLGHKTDGTHKLVVDHINDNKSDNRLENLQIVTQRENAYRTQGKYSSQYKGVCWNKERNKWCAYITINGKKLHLGYFTDEHEAHLAYQNKLKSI